MDRLEPQATPNQTPEANQTPDQRTDWASNQTPAQISDWGADQTPAQTAPPQDHPKAGAAGGIESVMPGTRFEAWSYREDIGVSTSSLVGYKVEATDGGIGKVDSCSYEVSGSYLVVDTGPWIFGKKVMIPAGTVNHIDHDDQRVYLDRTKDQVKSAPEFDPDAYTSEEYRDKIGSYYGDTYGTYGMPGATGGVFPPGAVPPAPMT